MTDADLKEIAEEEADGLRETIDEVQEEIIEEILPKSDADTRDCTLEVLQATGGGESTLFANDLIGMYREYSKLMGFSFK